jgi:glyoxylase-like metal-dependent hydrolase (beta-lactamase superfamily II)
MIEPAIIELELPPGALGPHAVIIDVRCFVVPYAAGVVLVDVGPPGSVDTIEAALARVGKAWSDVTDIVLTHGHFDHAGCLAEVAARAPSAQVWAGTGDVGDIEMEGSAVRPLAEGDRVGDMRVLDTPGHTLGHISLLQESADILLVGDVIGNVDGVLSPGPEAFTADPQRARRSLARVLATGVERILFSHGAELADPRAAIADYLAG